MKQRRALVREPGNAYRGCISCHPMRHTIDLGRAREQHARYCRTLAELGLEVIRLDRDDRHPDSCFIEDNAVVHGGKALISRMAEGPRRGEEEAAERYLRQYLKVRRAEAPATVEGGDVIHIRDSLISGVTKRTNKEGVRQMADWLEVDVRTIEDPNIVHLKSYATYLDNGTALAIKEYSGHPSLEGLSILTVPEDEAYAANTLTVNGTVLMPSGRPKTVSMVKTGGFEVVVLETSEFEKCEGALTCLSLII